MFFLNLTGCSYSFNWGNSLRDKSNNFNQEIIRNYSKGISRDPNNSFFYLERGKANHDYGDFKGEITDFNYSFKINPNLEVIFFRANSK